jgi:transposase, IS30 family
MNYTHLTLEERYQIFALLRAKVSQNEIAKILERHPSSISREIRRNKAKLGYFHQKAQQQANARRAKNMRCIDEATWQFVTARLREQWSPEQISAKANISHETIYQHLHTDKRNGGLLWQQRRHPKSYQKRLGQLKRRGVIPHHCSIEQRPSIVNDRIRIGDWETDTMFGGRSLAPLVTLVERKSGFTLIHCVVNKTAQVVGDAMVNLLQPYRKQVHTITSDNGKEFAHYARVAKKLKADFYFAHPYAAWERGSNENTNGLIRQYFPKSRDFATITQQEINWVMQRLNHRPRKRLGFLTPHEVFFNKAVALHT